MTTNRFHQLRHALGQIPFIFLGVAGTVLVASPLEAQSSRSAGSLHGDALEAVARGDTLQSIALLRQAVLLDRNHPESVLALGTLLARTAPTEERDFLQRQEAEELLDRAYRLNPDNPAVFVELALLKRKQNIRVDARRLLENATAPGREENLSPAIAADAHFQLGRVWQDEAESYSDLVFLPTGWRLDGDDQGEGIRCPMGVTYFCNNYDNPRDFSAQFMSARPESTRAERLAPQIESSFRRAISFLPGHRDANRALLAHLQSQGSREEFIEVARAYADLETGDGYAQLFLGLGLYENQQWADAEEVFDRGLDLLSPDERVAFEDVSMLLRAAEAAGYQERDAAEQREFERVLWARADPLYLIPANERRMEHIARVAHAELKFGAPELNLRGWQSDRGLIYIRYGPPPRTWKLRKDREGVEETGRWIFWNYDLSSPSFIFDQQLGYRNVRFDFTANTGGYAVALAEAETPSTFRSRAVARWAELPSQIVRFRADDDPSIVDVVTYLSAAPDDFELAAGDSLTTALFVFTPMFEDTAALRRTLPPGTTGNVVFALPLLEGSYDYSVEALAPSGVAGRNRGRLEITAFDGQKLAISDLLVAERVAPRTADPKGWRDFDIGAKRRLVFLGEEPVHLYFELYGLQEDADGGVGYRVELTIEDASERGVAATIVRTLGNILGRSVQETQLRFERTAVAQNGIVPDYLSLSLEGAPPGDYRIHLSVTDLRGGEPVQIERRIRLVEG